jgi:glycosyltransferase involved in cell wall biosynthesis
MVRPSDQAWYAVVLRIAIDVGDARSPRPRGWSRYVIELAAALRARDDLELCELAPRRRGLPEVAWEQAGLPLALRRLRPQVVHAPNCFLPLWRPCPGVVTIHDLAFEAFPEDFAPRTRAKFRWLTPRAARSAERVICGSEFTRDDVCSRYGVDPERVAVVPYAPSLPIGTAPPPSGEYVLGVGDLRAKKNWRRLVRAWRALRAEGLPHRLVIAGQDAGEAAALRELAGGEPLELPGYVDDARLDALMRGAACLVHPSLYEGFGLVVVEALARGVPVAAARGTALEEAGGASALYFDPLDEAAIATTVREALGRPADAGPAWAARFTWERSAQLTTDAYAQAAV